MITIVSEAVGVTRHHATRLVLCMEHAHAAARAVRGGYGGVLCMSVHHAACLRGAISAPRRGHLAIVPPATRCLRTRLEDDGVHLGHKDERPNVLQHGHVSNSLLHSPAQVFGQRYAVRGDTVCGLR
jgi:hypothetical protein